MLNDFKSGNLQINESILANLIKCWTGYLYFVQFLEYGQRKNLVNQSKTKLMKVEFLNVVRRSLSNQGIVATKQ